MKLTYALLRKQRTHNLRYIVRTLLMKLAPGQSDKKGSGDVFFFFSFSPQLILQKSNGQFLRNILFFKVPEGVQHFPGGPTFSGGSNCLFPIETVITCDFPCRGSGPPAPLWIRTCQIIIWVER